MTTLRQRMIDAMVLRGFAERTQWTYVTAVKQMAEYHDCSPELLSDEQIQASRVRQFATTFRLFADGHSIQIKHLPALFA